MKMTEVIHYDFFNYISEQMKLTESDIRENLKYLEDFWKNGSKGWTVDLNRKFKQNFKTYARDAAVVESLVKLHKFVETQDTTRKPSSHSFPPELYVHNIVRGKQSGQLWSHLKGQKIGLMFETEVGKLILNDIGTHQDFGWR